jgi:hypothetical protein
MNRVSWTGSRVEKMNNNALKLYGEGSMNYFYNQYQVVAGEAGAVRKDFFSDEVDDDFSRLAKGYQASIEALLLVGVETNDFQNMMQMAKIIWKASREQFKYCLAMNDIIYKGEQ